MILTCPTIHHGLMAPDEQGEWFCRQCGRRLYPTDDQAVETHPVVAPYRPLQEVVVSQNPQETSERAAFVNLRDLGEKYHVHQHGRQDRIHCCRQ